MTPTAESDDAAAPSRERGALQAGLAGPSSAPPSRPTKWIVPLLILAALLTLTVLNTIRGFRPSAGDAELELAALLLDPSTPRWVLRDVKDASARPFATVVGDAAGRRLFFATNKLPPPGAGRSYVLWTVGREPNAVPKSVGAVTIKSEARVVLEVSEAPSLRELSAFVVSVETDAKTPSPTDVVASGGG